MNKVFKNADEAINDINDGSILMLGALACVVFLKIVLLLW